MASRKGLKRKRALELENARLRQELKNDHILYGAILWLCILLVLSTLYHLPGMFNKAQELLGWHKNAAAIQKVNSR